MKAFSAFYDDLLPELPGCTTGMLDLQLLRVARQFCERSSAWRASMDATPSASGVLTYQVFAPEPKAEVVRVTKLRINGELQWCAEQPSVDASEQPRFAAGDPPFTMDASLSEITLDEQPTGDIEGEIAMRPMLTATSLPDVLQTQYLEAMRAGVLSRLMSMGGKPWTNAVMAPVYEQRWNAALGMHATRSGRGNTRAPLRSRLTPL